LKLHEDAWAAGQSDSLIVNALKQKLGSDERVFDFLVESLHIDEATAWEMVYESHDKGLRL
jgi:hypothetical protein